MKRLITLITVVCSLTAVAQYKVEIDLNAIADDQIPVTVYPPVSEAESQEYHMAKIVPGTYGISDFGRFVTDFQAFDEAGSTLTSEKISTNRWRIDGRLHKITYKVHDSFDKFKGYNDNIVFEPGGTGFDAERNVYVMNTFGIIGYIDGKKFEKYEVLVKHPENIYGGTALERKSSTKTEDVFTADDFNFLADGPIMYCEPDTVTKDLAGAKILVSVFSPNKVLSAQEVMDNISDLMEAQSKYLGGELPVDRYAYLIYLMDESSLSGALGALEHSYSSVYSLPEAAADRIGQTVRDVAAHEFLHIVTPLNIHSEQIGEFDYINPQMSKHLWLYEGVTEYSSMHVQVKYGLYSPETFLEEIGQKLRGAERYPDDVPFTEMSERILEEKYEPMYGNVYQKGALIGMCMDLYLIKNSNGEYDLQNLMRDLAKKYGKSVSFEDDKLFEIITEMTYPEIGEFLNTYVAGPTSLPIEEVLSWAGVNYSPFIETEEFTLGQVGLNLNENQEIFVSDLDGMNKFGEAVGYKVGDVLLELNGEEITLPKAQKMINDFTANATEGDKFTMLVRREAKGKSKEKKLKTKVFKVSKRKKHALSFDEEASEEQQAILKAWITPK